MFEMIIALFIVAVIVSSVAILSTTSIRNSTFATNRILANNLAQEGADWLRGLRDGSFSVFATKASAGGTLWCLDSLGASLTNSGACGANEFVQVNSQSSVFKRQATLTLIDSKTIDSKVEVTWDDSQGRHVVNIITTLTNWSFLP